MFIIKNNSLLILIIFICLCSFEISNAQSDSTKQIPPDSTEFIASDSARNIPRPQVFHRAFHSSESIYSENYFPYSLSHDINSGQISYSIADLAELYSGFDNIVLGPYGQPVHLFHNGLPLKGYKIGDFYYDYKTFSMPLTGFIDSRRIPLTDAVDLQHFRFNSAIADNNIIFTVPSIPDSGAITSAYMQRGDYGFTNTMIRFLSSAGPRVRVGINGSFKNSDGYIENTKKALENFRFFNSYQLNDNYQLQQDLIFFTSRDDLKYLNDYFNYKGESKSSFVGLSLGLASTRESGLFSRAVLIYQKFTEAVRGNHDKYRQVHESWRFKLENKLVYSGWENFLTVTPYFKRITFDPGYTHYPGINISDFSSYKITPALKFNFSAESDINKYSQTALSFDLGIEFSTCSCMSLYGQVFRISESPADFELFAKSPLIGYLDMSSAPVAYALFGIDDLNNTEKLGFTAGLRYEKHGIKTEMYLKHADLSNYYLWQEQSVGSDTINVRPVSHDARQLAGGIDLETNLPLNVQTKLAYSYNRIEDSDKNANLALTPRHKAIIALYRTVAIPRLNLDVLLNIEGEYHSDIYSSPYNALDMDDRLLMNFSVQFKIKTLTIYYNMDNVFDKTYRTIFDYPLGRGIWWGFLWNFYN